MNNPYIFSGSVMKSRYIDRPIIEKFLLSRSLDATQAASSQIVGFHRTGKSSMIYNVLTSPSKKAEFFKKKKLLVLSVSMGQKDYYLFFKELVKETYNLIDYFLLYEINERHPLYRLNRTLKRIYDEILKASNDEFSINSIINFYVSLKRMGYRVCIILDDFDYVTNLFNQNKQAFFNLRELIGGGTDVSIITSSVEPVKSLQVRSADYSDLENQLGTPQFLFSLNLDEREQYFTELSQFISVNNELIIDFQKYTGFNPYWMDLISEQLVSKNATTVEEAFILTESQFYKDFEQIYSALNKQQLLKGFLNLMYAPSSNTLTLEGLNTIINYGVIVPSNEAINLDTYKFVTEPLEAYFDEKRNEADYFPIWVELEKNMRMLVIDQFTKKYGADWETNIIKKYKKLAQDNNSSSIYKFLMYGIKTRNQNKRNKQLIKEYNFSIVDGMSTNGLFKLIIEEWAIFSKIFPYTVEKFKIITTHLNVTRCNFNHSNGHLLTEESQILTKEYITELSSTISAKVI